MPPALSKECDGCSEPDGQAEVPVDKLWEEAESLKSQGNESFQKTQYAQAITHYKDALLRLPPRVEKNPTDTARTRTLVNESVADKIRDTRIKIQTNLAAAHLKLVRARFVLCGRVLKHHKGAIQGCRESSQ